MTKDQSNQSRQGPGSGRGGQGKRRGKGQRARMQGGNCVCPNCGETAPHQPGIPCSTQICPNCQTPMMREGSLT